MAKLSINDLQLNGQRVFIRVDFNVPLKNGVIGDDTRIRASLPTIKYALDHGAIVVLASHLGRPKGKPNPEFSLRPIVERLSQLLGVPVVFADDCIGEAAANAVRTAQAGSRVVLLENLRFHPEEERTTRGLRSSSRRSPTYTSTTRSARRTGRTHRSKPSRTCCRKRPPVCSWSRNCAISATRSSRPNVRLSRFSVGRKCPTRSK